jgi:hypothetical protein
MEGRPDGHEGLPDCQDAIVPRQLDVSLCLRHMQVELWLDHRAYALRDDQAEVLALSLMAALRDKGRRLRGRR